MGQGISSRWKERGVHRRKHHETLSEFLNAAGLISEMLHLDMWIEMHKDVHIWYLSEILNFIEDLTFGYKFLNLNGRFIAIKTGIKVLARL